MYIKHNLPTFMMQIQIKDVLNESQFDENGALVLWSYYHKPNDGNYSQITCREGQQDATTPQSDFLIPIVVNSRLRVHLDNDV